MFKILKTQGYARRGEFRTPHGTIQTPAFMNVATAAAISDQRSSITPRLRISNRISNPMLNSPSSPAMAEKICSPLMTL